MPSIRVTEREGLAGAEESHLVVRARGGDDAGFSILVERYRRRAQARARAILGDDAAAEDACQEAVLLAYRNISTIRTPHAFGAWLVTIVGNVARRQLRDRREVVADLAAEAFADPRAVFDRCELRADLLSLIGELSPQMSRLARLHYLEGLGQDDIARTLAMPLGTVSGTLSRARQELAARFERQRRREAERRRSRLTVKTQGALALLCPNCARHRLEWRVLRRPGPLDQFETYCPRCSPALSLPVTRWVFERRGIETPDDRFLLSHMRRALQSAQQALAGRGRCPVCLGHIEHISRTDSRHARYAGEPRIVLRCTVCQRTSGGGAAALVSGHAPVLRFWRDQDAFLLGETDERIRVAGRDCLRLHYRSLHHLARLSVVADACSLDLLSVDVDYGRRAIPA